MRAIAYSIFAAFTLMLSASTVVANQGPPPKPPATPAPKPADPTMPLAGLGAAAGAVALGVWFLRSGTKPGK